MASPAVFHVSITRPRPTGAPSVLNIKRGWGPHFGGHGSGRLGNRVILRTWGSWQPSDLGWVKTKVITPALGGSAGRNRKSTVESGGGMLESGPSFHPSSRSQLTPPPAVPASQPFPGERTCPSPGVTSSSENNRMLFRPFHCQDAPCRGSLQDGQRTGSQGLEAGHIGPHVCFVWLAKYFYIFEPTVKGQVISYENPQFWLLP